MIVDVADIGLMFGIDERVGIALEMKRGIASIDKNAAQVDEFALDGEDRLQNLGGGTIEDLIFERVDAFVEVVDGGKVEVNDGVEDEVDETGRVVIAAVATCAGKRLLRCGTGGVGDRNEKVFPSEDIDGREEGRCSAGSSGSGTR